MDEALSVSPVWRAGAEGTLSITTDSVVWRAGDEFSGVTPYDVPLTAFKKAGGSCWQMPALWICG